MDKLYLLYPERRGRIAPEIYGHFTEHIGGVFYGGMWVGPDSDVPNVKGFRRDVVEAFRAIRPPVLRWPGGCFAETYDWRDGIGPDRPTRINWWRNEDGRYEPNAVGTHEFIDLCRAVGAKPYFAANVTSVPPLHIRDWMDYCLSPRGSTTLAREREANGSPEPFDVPFWGVGNENWGGGGNMTPEHYADVFRTCALLMRNAAPKGRVKLFACGTSGDEYEWARGVAAGLFRSERQADGFAMHYYCGSAGDPLAFTDDEWDRQIAQAARIEDMIRRNYAVMVGYGLEERMPMVVDEWGCWHPAGSGPSKGKNLFEQQSTMRDAVVAALTLNIFNRHCDKVIMANVAQLTNLLHSLFLCGPDGFACTPTYHVFDMYQRHQGAESVGSVCENGDLSVSVSVRGGRTLITAANTSVRADAEIGLCPCGRPLPETGELVLLSHADPHAHNTFAEPDKVRPVRSA
ncbi:MAG: alpha-N-arabinofuranosidase, partial [Oscillospiraceae bacterium]|nr:alpha-N-arabinofuranosidase [Oscillospiraceae bacterium]